MSEKDRRKPEKEVGSGGIWGREMGRGGNEMSVQVHEGMMLLMTCSHKEI